MVNPYTIKSHTYKHINKSVKDNICDLHITEIKEENKNDLF